MSHPSRDPASDRLESWKEIAAYLRRDIRTVQRWERREGLPVHRHRHSRLDSVYGFRGEIDEWRSTRGATVTTGPVRSLVGRAGDRTRLDDVWQSALGGARQIAFVTGELGIGKTSLIRAFLAGVDDAVSVTVGQCVQQFGAGAPYLPVLEGISALCEGADAKRVRAAVRRRAPSWASRLAALAAPPAAAQPTEIVGPDFLALELVRLIEALATRKPLIFVLEDIHWADHSTIELLARLTRRRDPARLLILVSYRPADLAHGAPHLAEAVAELQVHAANNHIALAPLTGTDVAEWLALQGRWRDLPQTATALHHRTEGNPLFLTQLLRKLMDGGGAVWQDESWVLDTDALAAADVPESLEAIIASRVARLGESERLIVEVSSVAGMLFTASMTAQLAGADVDRTERTLQGLVRRQEFFQSAHALESPHVESPGGYTFIHQFFQEVVYSRLPPGRRAELHRAAAAHLEHAFAREPARVAAELAAHFEAGGDAAKAAYYFARATDAALAAAADREAERCATRGLELLASVAPGSDRDRQELHLRLAVCAVLTNRMSPVAPAVEAAFAQVLELAERASDSPEAAAALLGLSRYWSLRGDVATSFNLNARAERIVRAYHQPLLAVRFHQANEALFRGEFAIAREYATAAYVEIGDGVGMGSAGFDFAGGVCNTLGWANCMLGVPTEARQYVDRNLQRSETGKHGHTLALACAWSAPVMEYLGERQLALQLAERGDDLMKRFGFAAGGRGWAAAARGWLLALSGDVELGLPVLRDSVDETAATGLATLLPPLQAWLADVLLLAGDISAATAVIDAALDVTRSNGVKYYDAELLRLRGLALALSGRIDAADEAFREGLAVARRQGCRLFEARLTRSISNRTDRDRLVG